MLALGIKAIKDKKLVNYENKPRIIKSLIIKEPNLQATLALLINNLFINMDIKEMKKSYYK